MNKQIVVVFLILCCGVQVGSTQSGRGILGYTANMMEGGKAEFHSTDLLLHLVDYGVSDHFTIGGGLFFFPGELTAVTLKAKMGWEVSDNTSVAIANYTFIPTQQDRGYNFFNPIYGLVTFNNDKFSITGGFGAIFSNEDISLSAKLGATLKVGKRFAILNESYWGYDPTNNTYDDNFFLIAFVGRYMINKWSLDLGVLNAILIGGDGNSILPLPHLGIGYRF